MAFPTVAINSGTGSDTTASGSGGTAVSGSAAATHANTTVNITDAVDLSGVDTTGLAALWVSSSSGRQWSKITSITGSSGNWTVTVQRAYANTESGRSWAVGGLRATCNGSRHLFTDFEGGWTIDIQTGETLTSALVITPSNNIGNSPSVVTSSNAFASQPQLLVTTNITLLDITNANNLQISNLHLKSTAASPTETNSAVVPVSGHSFYITIARCVIDGFFYGINGQDGTFFRIENPIVTGCEIKNCTTAGYITGSADGACVSFCYFHGNAIGFHGSSSANPTELNHCIFDSNSGTAGAVIDSGTSTNVHHCDFTNNTGDGLRITNASYTLSLVNNILYGNGGFGVNNLNSGVNSLVNLNNAYGANTSGARNNLSAGTNDVSLTANPFVSASDFAPNSTAGGGAALKAKGFAIPNASATVTAPDIGAIPSAGSSAIPNTILVS